MVQTPVKNFFRLKDGLDVAAALEEVYRLNMWNWINLRRQFEHSCHKEIEDVVLRFAPLDRPQTFESLMNGLETVSYWSWHAHLAVRELLVEALSGLSKGGETPEIGRVVISKIPPGKRVHRHADEGGYARAHHRLHIVLSSAEGNVFKCGDEELWMKSGEFWVFAHELPHECVNDSQEDRVHIIVDILK